MTKTRRRPNILITGTPGVGKTATATLLAESMKMMKHVSVTDLIKENKCYEGRDEVLDTNILDEEKLLDAMEAVVEDSAESGVGIVCDFHLAEIFPERWFDLVLVLRCSTEVLYDRLTARGYSDRKRSENMECEIMQVVLDEARDAYDSNIVHEVPSNSIDDMDSNVERVRQWTKQWMKDQQQQRSKHVVDGEEESDEEEEENEQYVVDRCYSE